MRSSFWIWFVVLAAIWTAALLDIGLLQVQPYQWFGCAVFMGLFFAAPLARHRPVILALILGAATAAATIVLWEQGKDPGSTPYVWLIYIYLFGKAVFRLPGIHIFAVGAIALTAALLPALLEQSVREACFLLLVALMLGLASWSYRVMRDKLAEVTGLQEALLSEYRRLKRYGAAEEEMARQQERTRIARDMHDSLGHKLTALTMQLEVLRMRSEDRELAEALAQLKELAQESLADTRKAVGALNQEESGGLRAILELIRKLEAESFVRVGFTLGEGVLSAQLGTDQAVAVFRAIQEALTNAMRHGSTRQMEISFEVPGGTVLRFEVSNSYQAGAEGFREGFGLRSMRERIESLNGQLNIVRTTGRFIVEGVIPLREVSES